MNEQKRWQDHARCKGAQAGTMDSPKSINTWWLRGSPAWSLAVNESAARCMGCPVIEQCARDALARRDVGTVRAGVPLPQPGVGREQRQQCERALHEIGTGVDPLRVLMRLAGGHG